MEMPPRQSPKLFQVFVNAPAQGDRIEGGVELAQGYFVALGLTSIW